VAQWAAEIMVGADLAARLVRGQFPELEVSSLEPVGTGFDTTIWRVDGAFAFRFPRRAVVLPGLARELDVLPRIAPLLPQPIPAAVFAGRPADGYPWPFAGARYIDGVEIAAAALGDDERVALATDLGRFLRALHEPALAALGRDRGLPEDPLGRADMQVRAPQARRELDAVAAEGLWEAPGAVGELLTAALALPPPRPTALAHGDLHVRQLLVQRGRLSGVLDWIDVCLADPAVDLSPYWSLLSPAGRRAFLAAYGPVPPERLLRARVLALFLCAVLARHGAAEGRPDVVREAVGGLARTLAA
jgi:aminoglycoside phosphotransferase (APT) family kinase protein